MKRALRIVTVAAMLTITSAFAQTSTSCTELPRLETTLCDHGDGTGTAIVHGDSSYTSTDFDAKSWAVNKSLFLQKEADSEAEAVKAGARMDAALAQEKKANGMRTPDSCVEAGFVWQGYCTSPEYHASTSAFGPPTVPAPKAALPSADYLNNKAAGIHTKKECIAAGFEWNKKGCHLQ